MTPNQLKLAHKAYIMQKEYEAEEYSVKLKHQQTMMTIQAYQISRWVWAKSLDINKILKDMEPRKQMTDEQMFKQVQLLNNLFGGEVVTDGKE